MDGFRGASPRSSCPRRHAATVEAARQGVARMRSSTTDAMRRSAMLAKVPEITALFWVIKVLTTGMGEATGDYLAKINIVLAGAVGTIGLLAAMWWQLRTRRYIAAVYWFAVVMVAVFGTMVADGPHLKLGVSYIESTVVYGVS